MIDITYIGENTCCKKDESGLGDGFIYVRVNYKMHQGKSYNTCEVYESVKFSSKIDLIRLMVGRSAYNGKKCGYLSIFPVAE